MIITDIDNFNLLTGLIVGEAASEEFMGKLAVGCVVRNRVHDIRWPDTYQGVILQTKQFSCFNHIARESDIPHEDIIKYFTRYFQVVWWRECRAAAHLVLYDWVDDITKGANHYYAYELIDVPGWAQDRGAVLKTTGHHFFKL